MPMPRHSLQSTAITKAAMAHSLLIKVQAFPWNHLARFSLLVCHMPTAGPTPLLPRPVCGINKLAPRYLQTQLLSMALAILMSPTPKVLVLFPPPSPARPSTRPTTRQCFLHRQTLSSAFLKTITGPMRATTVVHHQHMHRVWMRACHRLPCVRRRRQDLPPFLLAPTGTCVNS